MGGGGAWMAVKAVKVKVLTCAQMLMHDIAHGAAWRP